MPKRNRQGDPAQGYYPLPTKNAPLPRGGDEPMAGAPRTREEKIAELDGDLHERHAEYIAAGATCLTCGEQYPGTAEHGIRFNAEAQMYENFDAAHQGNWIIDEDD